MRALTEPEFRTVLEKLAIYTHSSLKEIVGALENSTSGPDRYVFRLSNNRVYHVPLSIANLATSIPRAQLLSCGICLGRFTKTNKFRLHITALPVIAPHAQHKLYLRSNGIIPFLYGGKVVAAHVGRWSQDCLEHSGVVVFDADDKPLGFGIAAKGGAASRRAAPTDIVCFRQADCGEYLREEDTLFTA
ncbi:60S ribosome subunit biogenesis protein NIP7 [Aspergillus sclerotiicarbonarius CBS 121057]|uniref:60S ribosome subunit biogenesis protein NIP7 n=1 Tax=Aspergillus sclerotiicarbonarius (strain CBS 121057 / IBT 28362) TaxID=1448318 RepID=A0A319E4X4_ASPSB|nr:60S ribosome subunit biogenesis protein NIP7 [Aspergillus sclerotiicarbonarius CBS 121057]